MRTAFVLGAGLGTRLRPLTNVRPKPLIPVCNRPLITWAFDHLLAHGVERFVVNTHWRSEVYARDFPDATYRGAPIAFRDEQPEVLETGGGIKNIADLLGDEPFVVYNGDILSDLPLAAALREHAARGNEVTLVLRSAGGPLQVACENGRILDIGARLGVPAGERFLFTGIYLVNPAFLARIPAATKVSVIPIFLEMIRTGARLGGVVIDEGHWWDLGSRQQYLAVHAHFAALGGAPWIHPAAEVSPHAHLAGATAIAAGARVGEGARLRDTVVWPGAEIAPGSDLTACVVTGAAAVSGSHVEADL